MASYDRLAEERAAPPWLRSPAESAGDATIAHPNARAAADREPVSFPTPAPQPQMPAAATRAGEVLKATSDTFDDLVIRSDVPVLVDFYADWCAPCRALSPKLHELAREVPDVRVVKVDIDQSRRLAAAYRVRSVPTLLVFKQGTETAQHRGAADRAQLEQLLDR